MKEQNIFLSADFFKWLEHISEDKFPFTKEVSLDLSKSRQQVTFLTRDKIVVQQKGYTFPLEQIAGTDLRTIFIQDGKEWRKWQHFDPATNRYYKMIFVAPGKPPTIEISGIKMHITQNSDPGQDTLNKLKSFRQLRGILLDTCTGLGYTAILSAKNQQVQRVFTCEKDLNVHQLCRQNPWSEDLFKDPKIIPLLSAVQDLVVSIPDQYVDSVIHDPPRFNLASELYGWSFYQQLYRILKKGGELYHYTGDPNQKIRRISLAISTQTKLKEVGFKSVQPAYAGIIARK